MAEEMDKSGDATVQVLVVPEHAMASVAQYLKDQNINATPGVTGSSCRFTTHGDLHCGDVDHHPT